MKKKIGLILGCILFIILAVGSVPKNSKTSIETTSSKNDGEKKEFKIGDLINTGTIELSINKRSVQKKVNDNSGYLTYSPEGESNEFLILNVTIKNISKEMISLDSSSFQLLDGDVQYSPTMIVIKDGLNYDNVNPGVQIKKRIFFDIPENIAKKENLKLKLGSNFFSNTGNDVEVDLQNITN